MDLSIIIVNYNTFELTSNCIRSIHEQVKSLNYEIIVVDNASTEKDPEGLKELFPEIRLIKNHTNSGFAKGNNLGIACAKGKYILLLNSDCELLNDAPLVCFQYMEENPQCGLSTVKLQYPDGKLQHNCRKFRTITWEILELIPLYRLFPKKKREEMMLHHYFGYDRKVDCDWVWGTFMFIRSETIQKLPGNKLAEDFFMYCEDVLWCWQIKQLGLAITFLPEGTVMHIHKASSKGYIEKVNKTVVNNHATFMKRIYPDWRWYVFKIIYSTKQKAISLLSAR